MKLYRIAAPTGIDALRLVEEDEPRPGRGQVLVRVRATSLNYRDLMVTTGRYGRGTLKHDVIPLSDGAGEVVAVGDEVTRIKVGDRVAGCFMQDWDGGRITDAAVTSALGGAIDGMLAEYVVLREHGVVVLPDGLSYEEGATLPCAAVTAWNGLVAAGGLAAGETVLAQGTGGVSIFALQIARACGAAVIITSKSDAKLERARALGAAHTVNYSRTEAWDDEALRLTGGHGVDHIVEVGGAGTLARSLKAIRLGGHIALIGLLSSMVEINPMPILRRNATVQGIFVGSREMFEAMNRAIAANGIKPVIDRVFPFAEAPAAYRYFESQAHFGKVVIAIP